MLTLFCRGQLAKASDDAIRGIKAPDGIEWWGEANKLKPIKEKQEPGIEVQKVNY